MTNLQEKAKMKEYHRRLSGAKEDKTMRYYGLYLRQIRKKSRKSS